MKRRTFMIGIGAAAIVRSAYADASLQFAEMETLLGGRIGLAAIDTGSGARLVHRGSERFAMCSTFKWLLAAALLAKADRGSVSLDQRLFFGSQDLLAVSPVATAHLAEGALPLKSLCEAAVEVSDNTAANLLLKFIGGPQSLTRYLRLIGDPTTRLDRFELALNTNFPKDPRDTTTPEAMITTMQRILVGDALSMASRDMLIGWMKNCQTGLHRLRAGLPKTWAVGDKTGTGEHGAVNDNAIGWPPGRQPIVIAAYLSDSGASVDTLNAAHAQIGGIVSAAFAQ
ncbi:MAG: class A beta-lactamase [Pseudomonadota bacterium]|nr:class A beta-lactamase [Pseudomonadota bacterium]